MLIGGVFRSPLFVPERVDFRVWGYTWGYREGLHFGLREKRVWGYIFGEFGVTLGVTFLHFSRSVRDRKRVARCKFGSILGVLGGRNCPFENRYTLYIKYAQVA